MRADLPSLRFRIFEDLPDVICASSMRGGGVSAPPFDSLNLGFSRGDDPDLVRENRRRFLEALEIPPGEAVVGGQVHGAEVRRVGAADRGRGATDPATAIPGSDGLVTSERGVHLLALSADCPLIAIVAPPARGIALAHSGWRGVAAGMPGAAVAALAAATGAAPSEMRAAIGPAIGPCCYEVGEEVAAALAPAALPAVRRVSGGEAGGARPRLDLALAIRLLLEEAGLRWESIEAAGLCSSCRRDDFFSHRRDGPRTGRIAMAAGLRPR